MFDPNSKRDTVTLLYPISRPDTKLLELVPRSPGWCYASIKRQNKVAPTQVAKTCTEFKV